MADAVINTRRDRTNVAFLCALASALSMATACDSGPADPQQIVATAEPVLLPGYTDLRSERDEPDVGVSVFSYKVPAGVPPEAVSQIGGNHDSCAFQAQSCLDILLVSESALW